ncbi:energy transducer TonB [Thalassotalea sp. G2M2-11]|uniref:energy transducer TonB n=1 Tax=Thalassotalea sp. G2M2-11 TaxID=2787627 RepID=UPI0019D0468C|nr:energy transducer TonB [Thalassotalea sp. G2M2-11]
MKATYLILASLLVTFSHSLKAAQWEIEKRVEPKYPIKAVKNGLEGCVRMQFFINSDGKPIYVEPIKSSNPKLFDGAAVKALSKWRYKPSESNHNKTPERQTVELSFSMSSISDVNHSCDAPMTAESNDIDIFRQDRLSMPIDARNLQSWKDSVAKIVGVLSDDEIRHFVQSFTSLISIQIGSKKDKLEAFLTIVNGLDYFQLMELADIKPIKNDSLTEKESDLAVDPTKYPLINMKQFFHTWEISDLAISIESNLYKEISYQLLKVELLIKSDGTAKLLSTCRKVSDEMKLALEESISDWQITKKVKSPKTVRFIYGVPAPAEDGAYVHCDDDWHQ